MSDTYRALLEYVAGIGADPERRETLDQAVLDAGGTPRPWPELLAWTHGELDRLDRQKEDDGRRS